MKTGLKNSRFRFETGHEIQMLRVVNVNGCFQR